MKARNKQKQKNSSECDKVENYAKYLRFQPFVYLIFIYFSSSFSLSLEQKQEENKFEIRVKRVTKSRVQRVVRRAKREFN